MTLAVEQRGAGLKGASKAPGIATRCLLSQRPLSPHDTDGLHGGLRDDQPSAPSGPARQQDPVQEPHPYALLARKRPREGRYSHHQPGDPVLYPHPLSVISELHRSTGKC